ncbi:MAG: hypothetical protein O7G83_14350 [Proteobacteria bacterium]|jgi:hypothetical protein|nr:hypothetical protein [Pseudomonadota bacterium]
MNILIIASTIFALISVMLLFSTIRHTRRRRVLRASGSFVGSVASASLGGVGILLALSYFTYGRLTDERSISLIEFTQTAPDEYTARLMVDGEPDRLLTLRGDEWQLDARVVNWKPPATLLGLDPIYQLERLSGRYSDIDREVSAARTVHSLADRRFLDLWSVAKRFPILMPGVDAYYGTATYVPMADGARFEVSLTRDALIARPVNNAARAAVGSWGGVAD